MGTLYECLREARLEKYYPTFRANGITCSETLSRLSIHDCTALGITSTDDKRRMAELINIIKSVHSASRTYGASNQQPTNNQTVSRKTAQSRRRETSNNSGGRHITVRGLEATRDVTVTDRMPNFSAASYVDMLQLLSESSSEQSSDEGGNSNEQNLPRRIARPATGNQASKHTPGQVERVKHTSGYNYGVPKATQRTKSKSASSRGIDYKIRVCVRKRPTTQREMRAEDVDIVETEGTDTIIVNEPKQAVDLTAFTLQHEFIFDEVFNEDSTNEDVYIRAARPLINCIFNNGNATCFAYGQTGAGKTHTMMGNDDVPGLYLLAAQDIFSIIQSKQYGQSLHVWVSFFEIYCGQLFDLLNRRNRLHAREDGSHKVCIAGLMETEAMDVQSLVKVLDYGNAVRSKGASGVNPDSSRSHAILQMEVRDENDHKLGRISFIDLAGSERAADMPDTDKQTRIEGAEINQSLLALKECIRSIDQSSRHKPFRQSKLTHILKESFVGNSRTCMIANISPTISASENTLNTLRYADRVKELKRGGSRGTSSSQVENLLMNIPITAPSVFHPANILSSSTPMRPVRHTAHRPGDDSHLHLDPSDTPVRGHFPHKKTTKPQKSAATSQSTSVPKPRVRREGSPSVARASPAREPLPSEAIRLNQNKIALERQIQNQLGAEQAVGQNIQQSTAAQPPQQQTSSPSSSDRTDSESCNLTLPRNTDLPQPNVDAVQSTDTEFDFPTSDFNVPEEMNDLNKASASKSSPKKTASGNSKQKSVKAKPAGRLLPEPPSNSQVSRPQTADFTEHRDMYSQVLTKPIPRSNSPATRRPHSVATVTELGTVGIVIPPNPSLPLYTVSDSIEDDLLFENPSQSSAPQTVSRTMSVPGDSPQARNGQGKATGGNQLSAIPAVMPACSSDLSFTQRVPVKAPAEMEGILLTPRTVDPVPRQKTHVPEMVVSDVSDTPVVDVALPKSHQECSPRQMSPKLDLLLSKHMRERRTRHASHSSQSSDDSSLETARTSQSDSAQGPYKIKSKSKSKAPELRKEKSDPILALHMQTKKKTLPNPEEFHKYLSRGSTPKASQISSSPMPVPMSKLSEVPPVDFENSPALIVTSDSDHTLPSGATSRASPVGKVRCDDARHSPVIHDGKSKSKTRMSVASVLRTSSYRAASPNSVKFRHGDYQQTLIKNNPPQLPHSEPVQYSSSLLHNKDNVSASFKTDVSQSSSISSELLGKNVQTTTGNFVVRNNDSLIAGKSSSAIIVTEKLTAGAIFSPIHPQPITSHMVNKVVSPASTPTDVVQPKPVTPVYVTGSVAIERPTLLLPATPDDKTDERSKLVMSHEDQLASVTSLCKQEMRLLLGAKSGHRSFEDYMRKLSSILTHKMDVIKLLQDEISTYCSQNDIQRRSVSQSTPTNRSVSQSASSFRSHQHL